MSESKSEAFYSRESHPHTGDPRVDPQARRGSSQQSSEAKKNKDTWYTAHSGIDYRTGRFGSDAGAYKGTIEKDTPIKIISKSKPVNGIVSVFAEFREGDNTQTGWFNMDDIRRTIKKQTP